MLDILQELEIERSFDVIIIRVASGHMHGRYLHHRYREQAHMAFSRAGGT